jgi:hypothetical protein
MSDMIEEDYNDEDYEYEESPGACEYYEYLDPDEIQLEREEGNITHLHNIGMFDYLTIFLVIQL